MTTRIAEVRRAPKRERMPALDLLILAYAFLLPLACSPQTGAYVWSPKAALDLILIGPGLVALVLECRAGRRSAWAAAGFLGWSALCTALASDRTLSLLGLYNAGAGLLFVACWVGAYAIGLRTGPRARTLLGPVLLAAAVLNAAAAWLQTHVDTGVRLLDLFDGRASALQGNPVQLTALCGAALWLAALGARRALSSRERRAVAAGLGAVVLLAGALQLSGGRTGIVLAVLVGIGVAWRTPVRITSVIAVALLLGLGLANVGTVAGTRSATGRVADDAAGGLSGRYDHWLLALPAISQRPLVGYGPGQFRRATSPHTTVAAARAFGSADTLFGDAHNLFVEYATTTGLPGLAFLVAFLVLAEEAVRRSRGDRALGGFAALVGISSLVEPLFVGLMPLAALALGAAVGTDGARRAFRTVGTSWPRPTVALAVGAVLALGGLGAGTVLLVGDAAVARAVDTQSVPAGRTASRLLPWSVGPSYEANAYAYLAITARTPAARAAAQSSALLGARAAVARDRTDPFAWNRLGDLESQWGSRDRAIVAFQTARRWNPWSQHALDALARLAAERGDTAQVTSLCARVHRLTPGFHCPAGTSSDSSGG